MRLLPLRLGLDQRGSVTVLASLFFIILTGTSALTIQGSDMYVTKLQGQRTADLATLAAANTSSPIVSNAVSATASATALNIAKINGFGTSAVATSVGANNGSKQTLVTTITTTESLFLTSFYNSLTSSSIFNYATATVGASSGGACVAGLNSYVIVALSAKLVGTSCGVAADTWLQVNGTLTAQSVTVGYNATNEGYNLGSPASLTPAQGSFMTGATITNTLSSNASVTAISSHLSAMSSWPYATSSPVTPTTKSVTWGTSESFPGPSTTISETNRLGNLTINGTNLTFSGNNGITDTSCTTPTTISGATNISGSSTLTFNTGCYVFVGDITNTGTATVTFAVATGATVTFVFEGSVINASYGSMVFGNASFSIGSQIQNQQGGTISFGSGQKVIGSQIYNNYGFITFGDGNFYMTSAIITQNGGTITFGNGNFYLYNGGISNNTFGTITFGTGSFYFYNTNIVNGNGSAAPLLSIAGGPIYMYNSSIDTGTNATTYVGSGNIDMYGGSMVINGSNTIFGWNGSSSTGSSLISFHGGSFFWNAGSLTGNGVTFAFTSGMFLAAGSYLTLEAPSASSPTFGYQNLLVYDQTGQVQIQAYNGATWTMSGVMYSPGNYFQMTGPLTLSPPNGGCLGAVADWVQINANATFNMAPCSGLTVGSTGTTTSSLQ